MARSDLLSEQTRRLYAAMPVMNILEPACALLILWLYWDRGPTHLSLITWGVVVGGISFLRFVASMLFRHLSPDMHSPMAWRLLGVALVSTGGLAFGFGSMAMNPPETLFASELLPQQAIFVALLIGLMIVAMTAYSIYLPAATLFLLSVMLPPAWHLANAGMENTLMLATVISAFILFLVLAAISIHRSAMDTLRLQYKNLALIDYLDRARADAEALNDYLSREIFER